MLAGRTCNATRDDGEPCNARPLLEGPFCFMHSPEHTEEVAEARRLGGVRRRRERVVSGAYDFEGLGSVTQIRRLVEVAVIDTLGLENSVARARTLATLAHTAIQLLESDEFERRLSALEDVLESRPRRPRQR